VVNFSAIAVVNYWVDEHNSRARADVHSVADHGNPTVFTRTGHSNGHAIADVALRADDRVLIHDDGAKVVQVQAWSDVSSAGKADSRRCLDSLAPGVQSSERRRTPSSALRREVDGAGYAVLEKRPEALLHGELACRADLVVALVVCDVGTKVRKPRHGRMIPVSRLRVSAQGGSRDSPGLVLN